MNKTHNCFFIRILGKQILFCNVLLFIFLFMSCTQKGTDYYSELEKDVKNPSTIEEYENGIAAHNAQIKKITDLDSQTGIWYKILGSRYLDKKMYGKALESFQMAIQYYPDNANLYYYVGVCAEYMAKASLDYVMDWEYCMFLNLIDH